MANYIHHTDGTIDRAARPLPRGATATARMGAHFRVGHIDTSTAYRYHRVLISHGTANNRIYNSQCAFWELT